jgi:hypothetical protein
MLGFKGENPTKTKKGRRSLLRSKKSGSWLKIVGGAIGVTATAAVVVLAVRRGNLSVDTAPSPSPSPSPSPAPSPSLADAESDKVGEDVQGDLTKLATDVLGKSNMGKTKASHLKAGAIVGIVIGSVTVLIISVALIRYRSSSRATGKMRHLNESLLPNPDKQIETDHFIGLDDDPYLEL